MHYEIHQAISAPLEKNPHDNASPQQNAPEPAASSARKLTAELANIQPRRQAQNTAL